jgi:hypothetical protein
MTRSFLSVIRYEWDNTRSAAVRDADPWEPLLASISSRHDLSISFRFHHIPHHLHHDQASYRSGDMAIALHHQERFTSRMRIDVAH